MSVCHFWRNSPFKTSSQEVFHNKGVPKKIRKTHRKLYIQVSFFNKVEGCWLKRNSGSGAFLWIFEFCKMFKNDYLVVHAQTAASNIVGYPYTGISSTRSTLKKCTVFSSILVFIHFEWILESSTTSGVYLESYQTSMMQKRSIIDIRLCSKYSSGASLFNNFPLSSFGYLNEYMNILLFFWKCAATLLTWRKSKILQNILLVPKPIILCWPWK